LTLPPGAGFTVWPVSRDGLLIGQVAKRSGASRKALRLYEAAGILPAHRSGLPRLRRSRPPPAAVHPSNRDFHHFRFRRLDEIVGGAPSDGAERTPAVWVVGMTGT
jgi:MerR family regulatory protein